MNIFAQYIPRIKDKNKLKVDKFRFSNTTASVTISGKFNALQYFMNTFDYDYYKASETLLDLINIGKLQIITYKGD